ncbi:zinc-finger domain of monoamine-oxidase A repressor R1 [Artemisia annua]|uniref:Zinc-finger domain of monoamine-oxidase A repressor R1 n=1 Tax=Artemisia annua TaxID=35608 RepID=A0A2U1N5J3_ARTAN|nr:zinc-finger domain of monoamine-oxidase A repressor R1 [Artemisia annua]
MESDEPSSKNGVPCHQCRHKTYGVYASCTNQSKTKPCLLKYCDTCLLNRYGEKAEDVTLLDQWDCPRCRGVCNCSTCMKKRGHQPTGIVKAKAGGFTSVSDMIHVNGAENVSNYKRVKETRASSRKQGASTEGNVITSPKKPGKENLLDGKTDSNADPSLSVPSPVKENPTKKKRKGVEVMQDDTGVSDKALNEKKPKKSKLKASKEIVGGNANDGEAGENTTQHLEDNQSRNVEKNELNSFESVSSLPTGSELVTIAGVDLPKEDAGNALQLLEFCYTFGKIVDVKKGHAEAALKDLIKGRSARRGKFTSLVQLHIQLLSVIQEESGSEPELESSESDPSDNDSWLKVLKNCISNSQLKHLDSIDTMAAGYDKLELSTKLGLLIFLCDEVLGTQKIRNWIDEENAKLAEKKKEAKGKLCAAKNKEKSLKQKIQDEVAKATMANYGVPITSKEYDAIVSRIKNKEAEEHAEMLECKTMGVEEKEKADAVRTEPIFKDNKGHMYWRLKGCSDNPGILLQDIGTGDHMVGEVDKWFEFDDEQMKLIEGHINILR